MRKPEQLFGDQMRLAVAKNELGKNINLETILIRVV